MQLGDIKRNFLRNGPNVDPKEAVGSHEGVRLGGFYVFFGAAVWGAGAEVSRSDPIEMTADGRMTVDLARRVGRAEGGVVIRRRDLVVCCDEAKAKYGRDAIEAVSCQGRVVIRGVDRTVITARSVEFRVDVNRLTLKDDVIVWRPDGRLSGPHVEYDLSTKRLEVKGPGSAFRYTPGSPSALPATRSCPKPAAAIAHGASAP